MPADALILNADDLGLWPSVDQGILQAWSQGAISDSTVFATSPDLAGILQAARNAGLPTGIHLNLTMGVPVSDPAGIPALVTAQGASMKRQRWAMPLPGEQVRLELRRQVQRAFDLGLQPTHLDSHHHIHRDPEIFPIVVELAREFRLPVRAVDEAMRQALRREEIGAPDHFSMAFYGDAATVDTLIDLTETCPGCVLEIMTHPGRTDEQMPSSYRCAREQELAALTDPRWHSYLTERKIPLIGYRDIIR
jgi:predicted glycoside hydrolase/deacetylase ChbG (UPF0249 family)